MRDAGRKRKTEILDNDSSLCVIEQKRLHLPLVFALLLLPNGTGARVHAVADRHGQTEELLGV